MIKTFIGTCSTENYQWRQFNTAEHRLLFEYNATIFSFTNHGMNIFMNVYNWKNISILELILLFQHLRLNSGSPRWSLTHLRPCAAMLRSCVAQRWLPLVQRNGTRMVASWVWVEIRVSGCILCPMVTCSLGMWRAGIPLTTAVSPRTTSERRAAVETWLCSVSYMTVFSKKHDCVQ